MGSVLVITEADYEAMLAHLQEVYPLEGCGLLAGRDWQVTRVYPVANILASPVRYEMDPQEQLAALHHLEASGWELVGIYHSHPQGPAGPSATDVAQAYYPEAIQLIVSFADRACPSVRAFRIVTGQVSRAELKIVS